MQLLLSSSGRAQWVTRQIIFSEALADIDTHFRTMNVRYMPIKGAFLILSGLAEKISVRRMQDLDILVEPENYGRTIEYFSQCKQAVRYDEPHRWRFEQPFIYTCGGHSIYLEIGFLLNRPERFNLPCSLLFARAVKRSDLLYLPSAEDAALILLCHVLAHIGYELRLDAAFEDLAAIASLPGFSWEEFWRRARQTGVLDFLAMLVALYSKTKHEHILIPRHSFYTRILLATRAQCWFPWLSHPLRVILWELPFVRDPWALIHTVWRERRAWHAPRPADGAV